MREIARGWNEFWAEFYRIRHLRTIPGIDAWNRNVVDHIIAVLELQLGARVLDLGCGSGEHACELARRGMEAVGLDIADVLVKHAQGVADREGLKAEFRVGDMRTLEYRDDFDACTILSGSFGFFDDDTNLEVLKQIAQALKPGGKLYIQMSPPPETARTRKFWTMVDDGYLLMEDTYDPETKRSGGTSRYITPDGEMITFAPESDGTIVSETMRQYTLEEYQSLLPAAGLEFVTAYGSIDLPAVRFGGNARDLIITGVRATRGA